jgi:maltose alpha-D-glucosyltransferase/alpha-amylase
VIARLLGDGDAILHDAVYDESFRKELFTLMSAAQSGRGHKGNIAGLTSSAFPSDARTAVPPSQVLSAEQSNSSMLFDNKFFLKLFRKLEDGVNPDVEVTRFLTERAKFPNVPAFLGAIEYRRSKTEPTVVCLLQSAVTNEGDAWTLTLDAVGRYYERVLTRKADLQNQTTPPGPLLEELIGGIYREKAILLGRRTGELHRALAISSDERAFAPEQFNAMAQRSVYQNMRASLRRNFALLEKKLPSLPDAFRVEAAQVLASEKQILAQEQRILDRRANATKIRIHGDYHLGQVLYTGKDFIILDFEGEPARALGERKLKRSALRDVAGMMRSFQYAAYSALWQPAMRVEDVPFLERWADLWYRQMSSVFLQSYLETTDGAPFVPPDEGDFEILLEAYLLDKAVYEIGYELNNRPDWVVIPIRGIKHILGAT